MELFIYLKEKTQHMVELLKLLYFILYVAHICGCFWIYLSSFEISNGKPDGWLYIHDLADKTWFIKYINAIYYSVLTMITVGHITTQSHLEKGLSIIVVIILSGVFAYSINTIGNILNAMRKNSEDIKFI